MAVAAVGAGIAVAGLAASWMASKDAAAVDAKTRAATAAAIKKYEDNYKLPNIDKTPLTQEEYQLVGQYAPKIASYIQEKSPEMVSEAASQDAISRQKEALNRYSDLSNTGEDAQSAAQRESGMAQAQGAQNRNLQSLLKAYSNQGIGGGGQELLGSVAAGQGADQQRRQLSLDVAAGNQNRRLQALDKMTSLAGDVRNQNNRVEQANVDAINAFNQRNSMNKQNYENQVAQTQNNAQQQNLNAQQQLANMNTQVRNSTNTANRDRADMIERENRESANALNRDVLNSSTGQAAQERTAGQDQIGRNGAMLNQALQGVGTMFSGYTSEKRADAKDKRDNAMASAYINSQSNKPPPSGF